MDFDRINKQFRAKVIIGMASVATLGIVPMAILRFARGEYFMGVVDLAIVATIQLCPILLFRGFNPDRVGTFLALVASISACAIALLELHRGVMWVYAVIIANFMLTHQRFAAPLSLALIASALLRPQDFGEIADYFGYLITTLMVTGFAAVFAWRTEHQGAQLEALALRDDLTKLHNRRALVARLEQIVSRAPAATGVTLLLMDLDRFKQINDTWGHETGDTVLREFARLVHRFSRGGDELYRLGGEEFVLLLPRTGLEGARTVGTTVLDAVREHLRVPNGEQVTVSIGACRLRPGESVDQWLARADALMYRAKRQGRDALVVEGDAAVSVPPERS